ncbi:MAG: Crp/Fnr family transcriptional regulator [Bacteroidales bacterium]|nr:Crp/Fnr family transcriptional regulator [Bacteroidales bacterium]MCF8456756.1 Crp/Fnr family transcriptional regulator [Bacteroidales bacterium]
MSCTIHTSKTPDCRTCLIKSRAVISLGPDEMDLLERNCVEVDFRQGEMLLKQNSFCTHVIFIKSGLVKIHMEGNQRKDQILKITHAHTYLGLANLFGDTINNYSATAIEATSACFIHINIFKQFIEMNGDFALEIIKDISREELSYYKRFVNHAQKQIDGRLAETILFFVRDIYKESKFNLPLNRKDLAALICASRESVIREMKSFANSGIIRVSGKQIEVLDENRLEQISENG